MKKIIFLLTIFLYTITFAESPKPPKNIIIMIGDGMGISQVSVSVLTNANSAFKKFPITGFSITCSADKLITDSAAGGTALACGVPTKNGAIGVDEMGKSIPSIFELAKQKNLSTGVVVTSEVTNATPAAFLGHTSNRKNYEILAEQFSLLETDIVIGGGKRYFIPESSGGKRKDNVDLLMKLQEKGYIILNDFENLKKSDSRKYYALLENEALKPATLRNYSLSDLTKKALHALSQNENGFVLMVEGSQIDNGGHDNNQELLLNELNDFENAIQTVLDFAETNKETLVLVTGDHETGGAAITAGDINSENIKIDFASKSHTATMVGVFAYGPQCEIFSGINENYHLGRKLLHLIQTRY
ncbi:MAG: alkaline phosphatase [Ignavibacteriaceae bacterium]|nr:alkaline phosphatase [Ignavibacteriaceae bacterium]